MGGQHQQQKMGDSLRKEAEGNIRKSEVEEIALRKGQPQGKKKPDSTAARQEEKNQDEH